MRDSKRAMRSIETVRGTVSVPGCVPPSAEARRANLAVSAINAALSAKTSRKMSLFAAFIMERIMGFMTSYKRLDNLCKDMNGIGISGYIEDMEKIKAEIFSVKTWKDDYYQLKHYRYIRNRIAHDNDAYEENLCTPYDTEWLENFYQQILNRTDPLALYYKTPIKNDMFSNKNTFSYSQRCYYPPQPEPKKNTSEWLIAAIVILLIVILAAVFYKFI